MSLITISTPFNIDLEFRLANFGKRVLAWFIDIMVISAYFYIIARFVYQPFDLTVDKSIIADILLLILPVMAYQLSFEIFFNGQTIGKKAMGIKIIDSAGQEPTWGQYLIRWTLAFGNYFVFLMPLVIISNPFTIVGIAVFYVPDVITILASKKSQRIGDLAAGTVVIDATYQPDITETIYKEIEVKDYNPVFPQVMRLTDRDINGIRNLLKIKRAGKDDIAYMHQVVHKIKAVLQIESELGGYDFLEQLLYDYNYLATRGK